jgi:CRP-like cAMP-binding protein
VHVAVSQSAVIRNRLLTSLPPKVLLDLRPRLVSVDLALRQPLYNSDTAIEAVYFPESGMISMVANLEDGVQAEVGLIGHEGMLGISLMTGVDTPFSESMVQMPGTAWRMGVGDFRREFEANAPFRALLLRYNGALHAQVAQTAACNGRHGLEQRLARWLLMARDRADEDELPLTQEFIAMMLGVHRPSVTVTAGILQRAGLIRYSGGRITVLDRDSLEAASCECYRAVQRRFSVLLGSAVS